MFHSYGGRGISYVEEPPAEYYCKVCDAQMNSDFMWDSHIAGKRHIKNTEKEKQLGNIVEHAGNQLTIPSSSKLCVDLPDRSKSDFYCKVCDSHMNSEQMWESHVSGKRHLKNVSKQPGEMTSQVKAMKINHVAKIERELDSITEPLVGLDCMEELWRAQKHLEPAYSCFLCNAYLQKSMVIDHIMGIKHKMAFLKVKYPAEYDMLKSLDLKKEGIELIVEEHVQRHESEFGRAHMEVKLEKHKNSIFNPGCSSASLPAEDLRHKIRYRSPSPLMIEEPYRLATQSSAEDESPGRAMPTKVAAEPKLRATQKVAATKPKKTQKVAAAKPETTQKCVSSNDGNHGNSSYSSKPTGHSGQSTATELIDPTTPQTNKSASVPKNTDVKEPTRQSSELRKNPPQMNMATTAKAPAESVPVITESPDVYYPNTNMQSYGQIFASNAMPTSHPGYMYGMYTAHHPMAQMCHPTYVYPSYAAPTQVLVQALPAPPPPPLGLLCNTSAYNFPPRKQSLIIQEVEDDDECQVIAVDPAAACSKNLKEVQISSASTKKIKAQPAKKEKEGEVEDKTVVASTKDVRVVKKAKHSNMRDVSTTEIGPQLDPKKENENLSKQNDELEEKVYCSTCHLVGHINTDQKCPLYVDPKASAQTGGVEEAKNIMLSPQSSFHDEDILCSKCHEWGHSGADAVCPLQDKTLAPCMQTDKLREEDKSAADHTEENLKDSLKDIEKNKEPTKVPAVFEEKSSQCEKDVVSSTTGELAVQPEKKLAVQTSATANMDPAPIIVDQNKVIKKMPVLYDEKEIAIKRLQLEKKKSDAGTLDKMDYGGKIPVITKRTLDKKEKATKLPVKPFKILSKTQVDLQKTKLKNIKFSVLKQEKKDETLSPVKSEEDNTPITVIKNNKPKGYIQAFKKELTEKCIKGKEKESRMLEKRSLRETSTAKSTPKHLAETQIVKTTPIAQNNTATAGDRLKSDEAVFTDLEKSAACAKVPECTEKVMVTVKNPEKQNSVLCDLNESEIKEGSTSEGERNANQEPWEPEDFRRKFLEKRLKKTAAALKQQCNEDTLTATIRMIVQQSKTPAHKKQLKKGPEIPVEDGSNKRPLVTDDSTSGMPQKKARSFSQGSHSIVELELVNEIFNEALRALNAQKQATPQVEQYECTACGHLGFQHTEDACPVLASSAVASGLKFDSTTVSSTISEDDIKNSEIINEEDIDSLGMELDIEPAIVVNVPTECLDCFECGHFNKMDPACLYHEAIPFLENALELGDESLPPLENGSENNFEVQERMCRDCFLSNHVNSDDPLCIFFKQPMVASCTDFSIPPGTNQEKLVIPQIFDDQITGQEYRARVAEHLFRKMTSQDASKSDIPLKKTPNDCRSPDSDEDAKKEKFKP